MNSVEIANELKDLLSGENINTQLSVAQLVEKATSRGEAMLTVEGALRAETGKYTGRSPKDKYTVVEDDSKDKIDWGKVNLPISSEVFDNLYVKVVNYLKEQDELFVFNGYAGADKASQLSIKVVNEYAWHNLFCHQLFIRPTEEELASHVADFTIVCAPKLITQNRQYLYPVLHNLHVHRIQMLCMFLLFCSQRYVLWSYKLPHALIKH